MTDSSGLVTFARMPPNELFQMGYFQGSWNIKVVSLWRTMHLKPFVLVFYIAGLQADRKRAYNFLEPASVPFSRYALCASG